MIDLSMYSRETVLGALIMRAAEMNGVDINFDRVSSMVAQILARAKLDNNHEIASVNIRGATIIIAANLTNLTEFSPEAFECAYGKDAVYGAIEYYVENRPAPKPPVDATFTPAFSATVSPRSGFRPAVVYYAKPSAVDTVHKDFVHRSPRWYARSSSASTTTDSGRDSPAYPAPSPY